MSLLTNQLMQTGATTVSNSSGIDKNTSDVIDDAFVVNSANETKEDGLRQPQLRCLWNHLIYEQSLIMLFADSNVGKSILAVQIADDISRQHPEMNVMYFDFELTNRQFANRYKTDYSAYRFTDNFCIAKVNPNEDVDYNKIVDHIEQVIVQKQSNVVIIDNLSAVVSEPEKGKCAKDFCFSLKKIKDKYGCIILLLGHTTKSYSVGMPLEKNTMAGSKQLVNFADELIGMAQSANDPNVVYLKQLKTRADEKEIQVHKYHIQKNNSNGNLYLQYEGMSFEGELLKAKDEDDLKITISELLQNGKTQKEIASILNMSVSTVNRRIKSYGL